MLIEIPCIYLFLSFHLIWKGDNWGFITSEARCLRATQFGFFFSDELHVLTQRHTYIIYESERTLLSWYQRKLHTPVKCTTADGLITRYRSSLTVTGMSHPARFYSTVE